MTNMDKLADLYAAKRAAGLIDAKFAFGDITGADAEELAGEILAMEDAIAAGKSAPLDFGDATPFFKALLDRHPGCEIVDVHFTLSEMPRNGFSSSFFEELAEAVRNSEPFYPNTEFQ
jgi:DNA-binding FadR family transcriptional regulator